MQPVFKLMAFCLVVMATLHSYGQQGFKIKDGKSTDKLDFEFINNLVIIPVKLNGVELSFLLDTGVRNTILFSLQARDSLELKNYENVQMRGLGNDDDITALKSFNNKFEIGNAVDLNHEVYVVLNQEVNFSTRLGKVVHGIVGYQFFKNFVVEINYIKTTIQVYEPNAYDIKKCRRCTSLSLEFHNNKAYLNAEVLLGDNSISTTLLLDSGSSDGLWLFEHTSEAINAPIESFQDFLGFGLSGDIFGERSRVKTLKLDKYTLKNVTTAFPDTLAVKQGFSFQKRNGSLGTEILRRFKVVIDYPNKRILLRKNRNFSDDFNYDMSGITLGHEGFVVVENYVKTDFEELSSRKIKLSEGNTSLGNKESVLIKYELKPQLVITNVRTGSPASIAGLLENDKLLSVNGKDAYLYSLNELNTLFSSKENMTIRLKIERNGVTIKKEITLKRRL